LLIVILGQRVVNVVPLYMNGLVKVGQPNSVEWDTVRSLMWLQRNLALDNGSSTSGMRNGWHRRLPKLSSSVKMRNFAQ